MALVLKTSEVRASVGSNPTLSVPTNPVHDSKPSDDWVVSRLKKIRISS